MSGLVSQTSVKDWKYIAEGGSTIVFSYAGPPHPVLTNKVLRLRKIPINAAASGVPRPEAPLLDINDHAVTFQRTIMHRLIPEQFLHQLQVVRVDKHWVRLLTESTERSRPEARRRVDRIDLDNETAVLADNLIGGSGFAVEIKVSNPWRAYILRMNASTAEMGLPPMSRLPVIRHSSYQDAYMPLLHARTCEGRRRERCSTRFLPSGLILG